MDTENEEQIHKEYSDHLEQMLALYKKEKANLNYKLLERLDVLKSNWYVWECERAIDGMNGTIQGDFEGELYAPETFEPYK